MSIKFQAYTALGALCMALVYAAGAPAEIEAPAWFKISFLDLRDDIKEATAANKRVMIYFGQNGCPYCKRLMEVNFKQPDIVAGTRRHFDAIEYASQHRERTVSFAEFQKLYLPEARATLSREEPFFRKPPYAFDRRKPAARPLVIFFEQPDCADCDEMHAAALIRSQRRGPRVCA